MTSNDSPGLPAEPGSSDPSGWWTTKRFLLAFLVLVLVIGAGVGVVVATSDDASDDEVAVSQRASSTSSSTSITSPTSSGDGGSDALEPATTTTTTKPGQPGIPLADEPTFSSVNFPASFQCIFAGGAGQVDVSWTTTDADNVAVKVQGSLQYTKNFGGGTISTQVTVGCGQTEDVQVLLQATGPGGSAVTSRSIHVTKP